MADTTKANVLLLAPELTELTENEAQVNNITVETVADSTTYTVTINGTDITFVSDADATAIEIAAGLYAAINAGAEPVTAVDMLDGNVKVTADVAGTAFTITVDGRLAVTEIEENWSGDDLITMILADVALEVKEDRYLNEEERAQRYLCAHILTKIKEVKDSPEAAIGGLQRSKTGDVERWWPQNLAINTMSSGYHTTKYGEIFLGIKQRYSLRFL